MALHVRQDEQRSKLQENLASHLQDKARRESGAGASDRPDGVEDSSYVKDLKQTTPLAWLWTLVILGAVGALVWLIIIS